MTVIQASSAGVKDMADGSLRITFEFEPRHAAEAFALFGPRGRAVAIAALKDGHAAVEEKPSAAAEQWRELGPLCKEAVALCDNPAFAEYVQASSSASNPRDFIVGVCQIASRKDLDIDPKAAERFLVLRRGFQAWVRKERVAA